MIHLDARQLRKILQPQRVSGGEFSFTGVQIDSREPCDGVLFLAIDGVNFDGHDYVGAARDKGAVAAVVERELDIDIPQILVGDSIDALARLANAWRRQLNPLVVAITGSNGKTTVKEMLGSILSAQYAMLKTSGNLNNAIGVPLTLFRLAPSDRYAVIEMGANHLDEIRQLVAIAEPDVVYVNNARGAHVEGFGSLENIVLAKGEMYRYCRADAVAVFNDDEPAVKAWKSSVATDRHLTCSMSRPADVRGAFEQHDSGLELTLSYRQQQVSCQLPVYGAHNAQNALAAVTLALACGLDLAPAARALEGFNGVGGRQQFKTGVNESRIIDDTYNANPDSLAAAVDVLCELPGSHWLALGDMAELGAESQGLHDAAVTSAREKGVEQFFALGEKSCRAARVFGKQGHCFDEYAEMASFIRTRLNRGVNLLVKGSRSARMERLVNALVIDRSSSALAGEQHAL